MVKKFACYLLGFVFLLVSIVILGLHYIYKPVISGKLYLKNAMGTAEILRESDTSIPHVFASSEQIALYTEGFLHAQERLW